MRSQRPRLQPPRREGAELLDIVEAQARWVRITPYLDALKLQDADDWPFIACALGADCSVITRKLQHFPARVAVSVMTVREWLDVSGG